MDESISKAFQTHLIGSEGKKPGTARTYINNVALFERRCGSSLDNVTHDQVVEYLAKMKLEDNKNANSRRLMQTSLIVFFKWYSKYAGINNPTIDLQTIKAYFSHPKLIHPDELEKMLYALEKRADDWSMRACAVLALLADTGIRVGELEALKLGNVRLEKDHFQLIVPGLKSNYERIVPFGQLIEGRISEYFAKYYLWLITNKHKNPKYPLFYAMDNKWFKPGERFDVPLSRGSVDYIIRKATKYSGIERRVTVHQFRHFYGTYSIINGMNIVTLKELMGHANIATTQRYVHVADRLSGNVLAHSPTAKIRSGKGVSGYSPILRDIAKNV
jgi:integrase/recombinase XerD